MSRPAWRGGRTSVFPAWLRRLFDYVLGAFILAAMSYLSIGLDRVADRTSLGQATVNDGDTITLGGERMRLRGIDAPEYMQTCRRGGQDYACGREARKALAALIAGRAVTCKGWERDRYNRLLTVCMAGSPPVNLNQRMVETGWAVSFGDYGVQEIGARQRRVGLWAGDFERPRDWRREHDRFRVAEADHADGLGSLWTWLRQWLWP